MHIPHSSGGDGQQLWIPYGSENAILTSDMSGFTRLTRQYGIIHFAGLIMQMRHLFASVFAHYGVRTWMTEADNCFAVFPSAESAVMAGLECAGITQRFNATVSDASFHVNMGGFGVDCGAEIIQDRHSERLFGASVDWAYHLGEEEADDGEVLISETAFSCLTEPALLHRLTFSPRQLDGRAYYAVSGDRQPYHVQLPTVDEMMTAPVGCTSEQGNTFIRSVLQRAHVSPPERERIDQQLTDNHLNEGAVVMLGVDLTEIGKGSFRWFLRL